MESYQNSMDFFLNAYRICFAVAAVAFVIGFGLYILYDFENFMQDLYKIDLFLFAENVLMAFLAFVAGYALIAYIVYTVRYNKAKQAQKNYLNNLKKLANMYEKTL